MADILIRDIPEPLKREIELAAHKVGQSLSDKAIDLLRKGMAAERRAQQEPSLSAWDAIRSAFVAESAIGDEYAEIMDKIEAEGKRDRGRPRLRRP
ncbi:plasmid stabilization protein [Mesorhizobium sp. M0621]|uniref:plasmid stabilization protein n=1 Tax=Mesorhizobium sp. M0621 TaxID=2956974 RepID=UPI0033380FFA